MTFFSTSRQTAGISAPQGSCMALADVCRGLISEFRRSLRCAVVQLTLQIRWKNFHSWIAGTGEPWRLRVMVSVSKGYGRRIPKRRAEHLHRCRFFLEFLEGLSWSTLQSARRFRRSSSVKASKAVQLNTCPAPKPPLLGPIGLAPLLTSTESSFTRIQSRRSEFPAFRSSATSATKGGFYHVPEYRMPPLMHHRWHINNFTSQARVNYSQSGISAHCRRWRGIRFRDPARSHL